MPQPGWYADPDGGQERLRWWDGTRWTDHVHSGSSAPVAVKRRGVWPWLALVLVAGLVAAVGFGSGTGLFGPGNMLGTTDPAGASAFPPTASGTPQARPSITPTPFPTIPPVAPTPVDTCPAMTDDGTLTDGQLTLTLPSGWVPVEGLTWLDCAQSATSVDETASVTVGVSVFPAGTLQESAEYVWSIALLDAAIPHPLSQTSTPVSVAGLDGWMVTGTVGLRDHLDDLTVIVVDADAVDPTVVVTLAGTQSVAQRAAVEEILQTLRRA